jgi:hypothetical protein
VRFAHSTPSDIERFGTTLVNAFGDGWIDYRPTLDIGGGSLVADEPVAFALGDVEGGGGLFEGSDLLDDGASPSDRAGPPDGEATAEWLTVSVTRPGSESSVARRTVFDRLPAHVRHGGEPTVDAVEPIELVDLDGTGSTDFVPMLGIEAFSIATGPTSAAAILASLPGDELGTFALAYHGLRDAMGARMAIDAGARTFVDGPNIVSFSLGVDLAAQRPTYHVGLDIWHRDHGILPLAGPSMTVAEAQLIAGVTGHIAEQVALESLAVSGGAERRAIGVGALFEAAALEGIPTIVLHGAVPDSMPYDPMATALIEEAVGSGDVVIIPAQPVIIDDRESSGWWRVDPTSGVTADVMDDASGSEIAEYEVQVGEKIRRYQCTGAYAKSVMAQLVDIAFLVGSIEASSMWRLFTGPSPPFETVCYNVL